MAASLLRRGCLYGATRKFTLSICSSHLRFYSSNKEGTGSTSSLDPTEEPNKACDNISETSISAHPAESHVNVDDSTENIDNSQNIINQRSAGVSAVSPTERAVDKFFKIVDKVKKYEDRTDTLSNISEAAATEKRGEIGQEDSSKEFEEGLSFATMLRKSKFTSLGDFSGRLIEGTIFEVMGDDLYIDFGGKFHCVCPRPRKNPGHYHRGRKVLVTLQAMEMSSAFLGSDIHVTLLEADGTLIGMARPQEPQRASTVRQ